jgi:hypothetical protein
VSLGLKTFLPSHSFTVINYFWSLLNFLKHTTPNFLLPITAMSDRITRL